MLRYQAQSLPNTQRCLAGLLPLFGTAEALPLAAAIYKEWHCQNALTALQTDLVRQLEQWLLPKAFYFEPEKQAAAHAENSV